MSVRRVGRSLPVAPKAGADHANANRQRKALKRMSLLEAETGLTPEQFAEYHRSQRERVLRRYGVIR